LLRCNGRQTPVNTQHREYEQRARSQNSSLHNGFACKRESDAQSVSALFLIW
jgi:hypothetical protein